MKQAVAVWVVLLWLFSPAASLADDIQSMLVEMSTIERNNTLLEKALEEGRERATLCVHCHGVDGNSKREYIPNLAGQNAEYLFTQFEKFADGSRKDYVMSRLAKGLTTNDKVDIALYFSRQQVLPRKNTVASSEEGKKIYDTNCFACHGPKGMGSAQYPRLAGQPYEYLTISLMQFLTKDHERQNSPMVGVVQNMNEQQLRDVSAYVTNLR